MGVVQRRMTLAEIRIFANFFKKSSDCPKNVDISSASLKNANMPRA